MHNIESFYREHREGAFKVALSILKNREDAEDVVQDVFIKLMRVIETHPDKDINVKYINRMVINASLSFKDTKYQTVEFSEAYGGNEKREADGLNEYDLSIDVDLFALEHEIDKLPAIQRKVMRKLLYSGMSSQEVADSLGIDITSVYSAKARAVKLLKKRLNKEHNE